jgi:hypothetical protein
MKKLNTFSNAFIVVVLLLFAHVLSIKKIGGFTPKRTKSNSNSNDEQIFIETSQSLQAYEGKWIRIKNASTKKCMRNRDPRATLRVMGCGDESWQYFMLKKNPDNTYYVMSKVGNYALDVNYRGKPHGMFVFANDFNSNNNQKWYINQSKNGYRFINFLSKKCLYSKGKFDKSAVLTTTCQESQLNQFWEIEIPEVPKVVETTSPAVDEYLNKPVQIVNTKSGKCLKHSINKRIEQSDCDITGDFAWNISKEKDNSVMIRSFTGDYYFDNSKGKKDNGNPINSSRKEEGFNQKWVIQDFDKPRKTFYIKTKQDMKCADIPGGSSANNIGLQLWDCQTKNSNQEFVFKVITPVVAKDLIKNIYLGKVVNIQNPTNLKCLKFDKPNSRLVQEECKNTLPFAWRIEYDQSNNSYFFTSLMGNYVIDNSGSKTENGNHIITWTKVGSNNQKWHIEMWDSKSFFFKNIQSGKCIDVPGGTKNNNAGIQLWDCQKGNTNQHWIFNIINPVTQNELLKQFVDKWVHIQNPKTGKCLRFTDGFTKILTFDCESLAILTWKLTYNPAENNYNIRSFLDRFAIENRSGNYKNGSPVFSTLTNSNQSSQRWEIIPFDNNTFFIKGVSSQKCLDIPGGKRENMLNIQLWDCQQGNTNQNFIFKIVDPNTITEKLKEFEGKWFRIQNPFNGKCWNLSSTNSKMMQGNCEESDENTWKIIQNEDQTYTILSKKGNLSIHYPSGDSKDGNQILVSEKGNQQNNKWYIVPWGSNKWRFVEKNSGKSIEFPLRINSSHLWESEVGKQAQGFVFLPIGEKVTIRGYLKNATNNQIIPLSKLLTGRASIIFTSGKNSYTADVKQGGIYEVTLPKGTYSRKVSVHMFSMMSQTVNINKSSNESNLDNTIFLSPYVEGWRVVLTWGESPEDLDSHMVLPNGENIFYQNKVSSDGSVSLDVDAKNGFGPETFTLKNVNDGIFKYFVNNYSKESNISTSKAKVTVFHGNEMVREILINTAPHSEDYYYWHVLDIDSKNGKINVHNKVVGEMS